MKELFDYFFYTENFLKIKTKSNGLQPFKLRKYQKRFMQFWNDIKGPVRIVALKPRQAGFSTLVSSKFTHRMMTELYCTGIVMADKQGRTREIKKIYQNYIDTINPQLLPHISKNNTEEIFFDKINSGAVFETGHDPNAGRSTSRRWAHLSEWAFIRYANEIDEGVQNSIPLDDGTAIIKESTANGRGGIGRPFYELWNAAKRGDSIYKPFFVAWYEVDDYQMNPEGFKPTPYEKDLLKQGLGVTEANLMWRRMKIMEYLNDEENTLLTPEERFKQDFPATDHEAFLSTGAPVFDSDVVNAIINRLNEARPGDIKDRIGIDDFMLKNHWKNLTIYNPPRNGNVYFIGADVAEGLSSGDASSVFILDKSFNQVAKWHGKIDSDLFGHLLMALGSLYNNALIIPEKNNMGISTVQTIKNNAYPKLYKEMVEDKVTKKVTELLGWRTTSKSKQTMLNEAIKAIREGAVNIKDVKLAEEMAQLSREENGNVNLNGKDRIVAFCLALQGRKHFTEPITLKKINPHTGEGAHRLWEKSQKKQSSDFY